MNDTKTLAVTTLVGIAHIICGVVVFYIPGALHVTQLAGIYDLVTYFGYTPTLGAAMLLIAGALAIAAPNFKFATCVTFLLPQQFLLCLQVWSISVVLATGIYPDGYSPVGGGWFILTDQIWPWLLTIAHTVWLALYLIKGLGENGDLVITTTK